MTLLRVDNVTSHDFSPPPSEFGRNVVIISYHGRSFGLVVMSRARLGVASERISHGWVNGSSSKRVGMRHEFGFQFEFRQLLQFSQQPIRSSEFSNSQLSSFDEEESSVPAQSSVALGLRQRKASSVGLIQSESFSRSCMRSSYMRPGRQSDAE